ncbi:hypothetical protein RJ639_006969 [Escallonia herrerae]|uniref:Uncharacterized protein n=1 Tax=Escallonia herrerae TaxID=1293975 RepID=A0AA88W0U7_9ASTE|nr:hypothetical protein RJ639_006969 [Escallonia herrerae]
MQRGKPVKDLVSIEVYPGEENKTVRICSNLKEDTKLELVNLLRIYANVFAWIATDMPGIDPKIITHRLNVNPFKKPLNQKKRTFKLERQERIEEEVDKLLAANFIEEIYYLVGLPMSSWNISTSPSVANKDNTNDCATLYQQMFLQLLLRLKPMRLTTWNEFVSDECEQIAAIVNDFSVILATNVKATPYNAPSPLAPKSNTSNVAALSLSSPFLGGFDGISSFGTGGGADGATGAGVYSMNLNLANECTYTVWPVMVSGHGTPPLTTTIFMLEPGESASLLIPPSWSGQLWAHTLCSYGLTGRFNCLTDDYGTGSEECA